MGALEHNDMRAFVSEPFSDVMEVRARLKQCILLDDADVLGKSSRQLVVFFWEHRFQVVASVFKGLGYSDMLLDKRVVAMARYDREHGSSYLETAVMSVRFPGSPAEAAEALSVHRNTTSTVNSIGELFKLTSRTATTAWRSFTARVLGGARRGRGGRRCPSRDKLRAFLGQSSCNCTASPAIGLPSEGPRRGGGS